MPHPRRRFDRNALLPRRLQIRIDSWSSSPPRSQFSMYGPLNAYLQGHKFPSNMHLVKPQSKLQEEAAEMDVDPNDEGVEMDVDTDDEEDEEDEDEEDDEEEDDEEDEDEDEDEEKDPKSAPGHRTVSSVDSYGAEVAQLTRYLDFTVCQYFGTHHVNHPDILRIVIEIGSDKATIRRQVTDNLDLAGPGRWRGEVLGVGIVGTSVWMARNNDPTGNIKPCYNGRWLSLYGKSFVNELNRVKAYSEAHNP